MSINYIQDPDLEFFGSRFIKSRDLNVLVDHLLYGQKSKRPRLRSDLITDKYYKNYKPDHKKYWRQIAGEVQLFGGNTIMNVFRGCGVPYKKVLRRVAKLYKIKYEDKNSCEDIELKLIQKVFEEIIKSENISKDDLKQFLSELNIQIKDYSPNMAVLALQLAIANGGMLFIYRMVGLLSTFFETFSLGALSIATESTLVSSISAFSGPVGLIGLGIVTMVGFLNPQYRVIVPSTIIIAMLRQIYNQRRAEDKARRYSEFLEERKVMRGLKKPQ